MKLQQLFAFFDGESLTAVQNTPAGADVEITNLCFDARQVVPNSIFVAIKGVQSDGHDYIPQAIENGAVALVVTDQSRVPTNYEGFVVSTPDTRQVLDLLAARFYDYPSNKLFCFGITGTNGKTSLTYLIEHIFVYAGKKIGIMGTVNHRIGHQVWDSQMTTPDPVTLQKRLQEFLQAGASACAMEVSSHALDQKRADSVHFNTVIFTNLTLDHLDYHKTMDHYFQSKQRLFTDLMWQSLKRPLFAVVNIDDPYGRQLKVAEPVVAWTYGQKESDFQYKILKMNFAETVFELKTPLETIQVQTPLTGVHNVANCVAAMAACLSAGITIEVSAQALRTFVGVPGRLQRVLPRNSDLQKIVFVDYAHTPDALENTLASLNQIRQNVKSEAKIWTVFGCGGDRDRTKRPIMARIACEKSDYVIITSDNPRTEKPEDILKEIFNGVPAGFKNVYQEIDREKAIAWALEKCGPDDVILIAGKGHENYQIIGTEKIHFDDTEIAQKYMY